MLNRRASGKLRSLCAFVLTCGLLDRGCSRGSERESAPARVFVEIAAEVGLDFVHNPGATGEYFLPEIMGAGVALFDYDRDGDLDVYAIQGAPLGRQRPPKCWIFPPSEPLPLRNRLYRNELDASGRLSFTDVTELAGVGDTGRGMGCAVADYDGDGDLDLYVTNFGPNVLYRNEGDGTFSDVTRVAGVGDDRWNASAAFLDYDRDGNLDLFVTGYVDFNVERNTPCYASTSARDYCSPKTYNPIPDRLYHNEGDGSFSDATFSSGIHRAYGNGLGVATGDYNGDGWIDIYVANDATANQLWINQRDGSFLDEALLAGVAFNEDGAPEAGMGVTAGDYDQDGDEDLFLTHLIGETNTLYRNAGGSVFLDCSDQAGLGAVSLAMTGFGTAWLDYDNDGLLDLFTANGGVKAIESLLGQPYPYQQHCQLFWNTGRLVFEDRTEFAGPSFRNQMVGRGAAFGDIDNDGDVDIVVSDNGGPLRLLRNEAGHRRHSLVLRLQGSGRNLDALGARVALRQPGGSVLWQRVRTDGSYLSASDHRVYFGLDDDPRILEIVVFWPDGQVERWSDLPDTRELFLHQDQPVPLR